MKNTGQYSQMFDFWARQVDSAFEFNKQFFNAVADDMKKFDSEKNEKDSVFFKMGKTFTDNVVTSSEAFSGFFGALVDGTQKPQKWWSGWKISEDSVFNRMAEGSSFAELWEAGKLLSDVNDAWLTVQKYGSECGVAITDTFMKANMQFADKINELAKAGEPHPDVKTTFILWDTIASNLLNSLQRDDEYLKNQSGLLRAFSELRIAQKKIVDRCAEQAGLPTRSEIDDLHKTVTELRREVRMLKQIQNKEKIQSDADEKHTHEEDAKVKKEIKTPGKSGLQTTTSLSSQNGKLMPVMTGNAAAKSEGG